MHQNAKTVNYSSALNTGPLFNVINAQLKLKKLKKGAKFKAEKDLNFNNYCILLMIKKSYLYFNS